MINDTKLIRALSLSSLSNNIKRLLSAQKGEQPVADTNLPYPLLFMPGQDS